LVGWSVGRAFIWLLSYLICLIISQSIRQSVSQSVSPKFYILQKRYLNESLTFFKTPSRVKKRGCQASDIGYAPTQGDRTAAMLIFWAVRRNEYEFIGVSVGMIFVQRVMFENYYVCYWEVSKTHVRDPISLRGTRWRCWLRHCATNRKVAVSIPDCVIGIFL
jgi:hypothetical protein